MSDLHNTRSAARLLGVSEASVRRWSDAGLLPVQRVGRRGTRRFAETDLRRFAASHADKTQANLRGQQLETHDHFATFYDSDPGRMRLSLPFLRTGLASGDRCILVAADWLAERYIEALTSDDDPELRGSARNGALVIRSGVGSSAREAIAAWQDLWLQALGAGFTGIRVVGEMATYEGFSEVQEMLDYEVAYDSVSKRFPVMTLCQYDVRHFDGKTVLAALQVHPDLFTRRIADFLF
jgi:transcriptional repressor of dcmA and dcmR